MMVARLCSGVVVALLLQACGEAQFAEGVPTPRGQPGTETGEDDAVAIDPVVDPPNDPPTGETDPPVGIIDNTEQRATSLTWHWQCASSPGTAPTPPTPDDVVVVGSSDRTFQASRFAGVPMTVQGEICPLETQRDIVFVIDVSGSMGDRVVGGQNLAGNDPRINGSCGRLAAMQSVIDSATAGSNARFAGVTFNGGVATVSPAFASNAQGIFTGNLADVVCAAAGGTNYTASLDRAEQLLLNARPGASKEIYFITDGQPYDGAANPLERTNINGVPSAARLHAPPPAGAGVTIVTVMLGVDAIGNNHLQTLIASKSPAGTPLHANVANASQLAATVTQLAQNDLSIGSVKYRAIGASTWAEFNLLSGRSGNRFALPPITIDVASAPYGLEMEYSYQDKRGKTYSSSGSIKWTSTPAQ